jgi:hypothetical protein
MMLRKLIFDIPPVLGYNLYMESAKEECKNLGHKLVFSYNMYCRRCGKKIREK